MATLTIPNEFQAGTPAEAAEVNQNFEAIELFSNTSLAHTDGSKPFDNLPSGPNVDPSSATQLANKRYVDGGSRTLAVKTHSSSSLLAYGTSARSLGLDWSFVAPALRTGQFLKLSLFIPWVELSVNGSGRHAPGDLLQVRLTTGGGSTVRCMGQTVVSASNTKSQPSIYGQRLWSTSPWAAGSTVNVQVMGQTPNWTKGAFQAVGDADRPIQFVAEVV